MSHFDNLKKYNFNFSHSLGQNFIFDKNLLNNIVNLAGVDKNTDVLEIGCGAGTLTHALSTHARTVVGYEIDRNLIPILSDALKDDTNVTIHYSDIMDMDMSDIESQFAGNYMMIANLPYYITTPIIFKFLDHATKLTKMAIMVQYEVAERLTAKENTANYGAITPQIQLVANTRILKKVPRNMFTPAPNVDSAVVEIAFANKYTIEQIKRTKPLIKYAFAMRRKTLVNNLKSGLNIPSEKIQSALQQMNLPASVRGEALSCDQFVTLADLLA